MLLVTVIYVLFSISMSVCEENKKGQHWALLVAGSNGYYNYRHQADVCHAYHVLNNHGIPDERIVVMMYDDIANNSENPTKGVIINHPDGQDVYAGVPKDYTGKDVTPENFLKIMQGDAAAMKNIGTGKVIQSGKNDFVFVYFSDHGAPGLIAFPDSELHADDLVDAIKSMYKQKKYKQLLFYLEACESGSMFKKILPKNINVYATTAANPKESSYACYYDEKRETYLGDLYSVMWMEDSDAEDLKLETLQHQYDLIKSETNLSHVKQYGDLKIAQEHVAIFQGQDQLVKPFRLPKVPFDAVRAEDVPMAILHRKLAASKSAKETEKIAAEMRQLSMMQENIRDVMESIVRYASKEDDQVVRVLKERLDLTDHACYKTAVKYFDQYCFDLSTFEYALRHLYALLNLCEESRPIDVIIESIKKACVKPYGNPSHQLL